MRSYVRLGLSILSCYGAGFLSSLFVQTGTGSWYEGLVKPALMPDKLAFPVVWVILYGLMAIALWRVWEKDPHVDEMRGWVPLFFVHLLLNASWAIFFFGFRTIFIAFIDSVILLAVVIVITAGAWEIDRKAGWLILPYPVWVLFATYLNLQLWLLN